MSNEKGVGDCWDHVYLMVDKCLEKTAKVLNTEPLVFWVGVRYLKKSIVGGDGGTRGNCGREAMFV